MLHGDNVKRVKVAAFSPDGRWVATGAEDSTARVWDTRTGFPITEPLRHRSDVSTLRWLPDSRTLLTGSHDGTIRRWHLPKVGTAPAWLPELAEALAGKRDGRDDGAVPIPPDQLDQLRRQAMTNRLDAPDQNWLKWFFVTRLDPLDRGPVR